MNRYVTDTHALFWYLTASPRLSKVARAAFREAEQGQAKIVVPAIVVAELYFLNDKLGQVVRFDQEYKKMQAAGLFEFAAIQADAVLLFPKLGIIPEMHDRLIAAVAYQLGAPLLSRAKAIQQSGVVTVKW